MFLAFASLLDINLALAAALNGRADNKYKSCKKLWSLAPALVLSGHWLECVPPPRKVAVNFSNINKKSSIHSPSSHQIMTTQLIEM